MSEMGNIGAGSGAENRAARRTNLMLAAQIETNGRRARPVKGGPDSRTG